jgi:hypothetical protein
MKRTTVPLYTETPSAASCSQLKKLPVQDLFGQIKFPILCLQQYRCSLSAVELFFAPDLRDISALSEQHGFRTRPADH